MEEKYVITIGRQLGSGGKEIGTRLAETLGIAFYDKELIQIASKESGLGKEYFERADEKKRFPVFGSLFGLRSTMADDTFAHYYLSNEALYKIQSDVIRNLADSGSCVFVGRCADYILKDHPRCLNLFITANKKERISRITACEKISEEKAAEIIEKSDRQRAGYYNYFSNKEWGVADTYHLCINSSMLGIDGTVGFLKHLTEQLFGI